MTDPLWIPPHQASPFAWLRGWDLLALGANYVQEPQNMRPCSVLMTGHVGLEIMHSGRAGIFRHSDHSS